MGKSKSSQTSTNQFSYVKAPENPYYKLSEKLIDGYDGGAGAVREGYARNINDIKESGNEFLGANTPAYVRDKMKQSRLFRNNMDLGRGLADAKQNEVGYKTGAYMSLGGATAPTLVQTGGTMQGTQSRSPFDMMMGVAA